MSVVVRGYKVELQLNNQQRTACLKHAGAARYVYNWGLRRYQEEREAGRKSPTAISLHKELNVLKQSELSWMYEVVRHEVVWMIVLRDTNREGTCCPISSTLRG